MPSPPFVPWPTTFVVDGERSELPDPVVVEDPLEIRLATPEVPALVESGAPLAVTLRTPGHDRELVAGLLYAEGLIASADDVVALEESAVDGVSRVVAVLAHVCSTRPAARAFLSTSACGVCGKGAVDEVFASGFPALPSGPRCSSALLASLPERMRGTQEVFAKTGGLHAAALFDAAGELLLLREDVGRHNALDKLVGALLLAGELPAGERLLAVSGRVGFELVQKALRAGLPTLVAVGAPSTLALRLADRAGMTLAGFVRPGRCNVYTGLGRVTG